MIHDKYINKVILLGNIESDRIELRQTRTGQTVTNLKIKIRTDEKDNIVPLVIWGDLVSKIISLNLQKGDKILIEGQLVNKSNHLEIKTIKLDKWSNPDDLADYLKNFLK